VKKPKLLLLDADVVIFAHQLDVWTSLKSAYEIHLPATILDEAKYFETKQGNCKSIDVQADLIAGLIKKLEADVKDLTRTFESFDPVFLAALHDGEKEAITILASDGASELIFCTGDVSAMKAVGMLDLASKCISFEEVLEKAGLLKHCGRLQPNLTKSAYSTHSAKGKTCRITGESLKKPII